MKDKDILENTEEDNDFEEDDEEEVVEPTPTRARHAKTPISPSSSTDEGPSDVCQYCGESQDHYDYRKEWRGWVKCPSCGKKSRIGDVPEELVREVKTVDRPSSRFVDEEADEVEDENSEGLFRRPKTPDQILNKVMEEYGVKDVARQRIVARVKRIGEPEVADIDRMLKDFDTGIQQKQISYIIEDYLRELDLERDRASEMDGTVYPIGRRRRDSEESSSRPYYGSSDRRRYPSRYGEPESSAGVSRDELIRLLDERDRRNREREDQQKKEDIIREQKEMLEDLREELREQRENPPSTQDDDTLTKEEFQKMMTEQQNQTMLVMMKDQLEQTRREADRLRDDQKEERRMLEAKIDKLQDNYDKRLEEANKKILEEQRRADTKPAGDGYQHDETRLLADAVREGTEVLKSRGSIADGLAKLIPALSNLGGGNQPVGINKKPASDEGPSVADLMDDEYVR